jgi:hypothetical protein
MQRRQRQQQLLREYNSARAVTLYWKKKKRGYRVCSSGYAATDTS